jgi:hypothetical protein
MNRLPQWKEIHMQIMHPVSRNLRNPQPAVWRTAALVAVVAMALCQPLNAHATAIGYDHWNIQKFKDIPIPSGQLTGGVFGKGLHVNVANGNFLSAGNLCNWHIDVDAIDAANQTHKLVQGRNNPKCTHVGEETYRVNGQVPPGRVCIRLYTAFTHRIASVCHNIIR